MTSYLQNRKHGAGSSHRQHTHTNYGEVGHVHVVSEIRYVNGADRQTDILVAKSPPGGGEVLIMQWIMDIT